MLEKELVLEVIEQGINFFPSIRNKLKASKIELNNILEKLVEEGSVYYEHASNKYFKTKVGRVQIKEAGYGFILVDGESEDYYITKENLKNVYDGDKVLFYPIGRGERLMNAKIQKVIERAHPFIIGKYKETIRQGQPRAYIVSVSPQFPVKANVVGDTLNAQSGMIVYATLDYSKPQLVGQIKEVLGHKDDPGIEISQIALEYGFLTAFPEEVIEEIAAIPNEVLANQKTGRRDFTDRLIITIDGDDSKDFDDAVDVVKNEDGSFNLGVYIADVAEYVKEGTPLDKEALKRGTSVYLADRVIPMIPHKLSNGICSLNEGVDRLVLACLMKISKEGNLVDYEITEGVIKSRHRMTYQKVNQMLEADEVLCQEYEDLVPMIQDMLDLSNTIRKRRHKKGGIEFDVAEYKFTLNEDGSPKSIDVRTRGKAEMLIEDLMLQANETVAYHMNLMQLPCVYRVHEKPDQEKLRDVFGLMSGMGIEVTGVRNNIHPKQIQDTLEKISDSPFQPIISTMLLRSMMKARYSAECLGHYGLAMNYYCHFTSPIRRYPDLMTHRMIKRLLLHPGNLEKDILKYGSFIDEIAVQNSISERKAIECERSVNDMLYAWYMEANINKKFPGVITSVTSFGMFIALPNGVEGLVNLNNMSGYYVYNQTEMSYSNGTKTYRIGDKVQIVVLASNRTTRRIDFMFAEDYEKSRGIADEGCL